MSQAPRLTEQDCRTIRSRISTYLENAPKRIAQDYGVSPSAISSVRNGKYRPLEQWARERRK